MKKLIFILMAGSLFAQYIPDVSNMSEAEKMLVFTQNKKEPTLGIVYPLLLPTLGHAYAKEWKRGLLFFGAEIFAFSIVYKLSTDKAHDNGYYDNNCPSGSDFYDERTDNYDDDTDHIIAWEGAGCYDYWRPTGGFFQVSSASLSDEALYDITLNSLLAMGLVRIFEIVDASTQVKNYNNKLYKEIFGKEPPSFSLNLQPTYQGANLTMSYAFD